MMSACVPVTILTGFLGAGKTTLLNRLLQEKAMANVAVIINEFGDISLDHLLVESSEDGIIELSSGCICCTIRGELVETLERVFHRHTEDQPLAGIVIETTGLADPLPVMQAIMAHPSLSETMCLGAVITLVDAVNGVETLQAHEVASRQIAVADRLLVTKCDLIDGDIPEELREQVSSLNPACLVSSNVDDVLKGFFASFGQAPISSSDFMERMKEIEQGTSHSHNHHKSSIEAFSLMRDRPIERAALSAFIDLLASAHGPQLLRMKGLVQTVEDPEKPVLLHGVQSVFHPPVILEKWPDEDRLSRLVFITDGLKEDFVKRLYDGFCGVAQVDMADKDVLLDNPLAIAGFKPG